MLRVWKALLHLHDYTGLAPRRCYQLKNPLGFSAVEWTRPGMKARKWRRISFRKASRVERTAEELDNVIRSAKSSSFNPIDIDNHRDNAVTG